MKGKAFKFGDNISTDHIAPGRLFHLRSNLPEFAKHVLEDADPNFASSMNKGDFVVAGNNFGLGSSREHAAWALKDFGFLIIIAGSFSDIFYMNCTKNGMLPIAIENKTDRESIAQHSEITIDLPNQEIITPEAKYHFDIDATWKNKLVNGLDDIAITLTYEDQINEYEKTHN